MASNDFAEIRVLLRQIRTLSGQLAEGLRNDSNEIVTGEEQRQRLDQYIATIESLRTEITRTIGNEVLIDNVLDLLEQTLAGFFELPNIELDANRQREIQDPFNNLHNLRGMLNEALRRRRR
jgi:hypothetical protein